MFIRLYGVASAIPRRCNLTANWRDTQLLLWMLGSNSGSCVASILMAALSLPQPCCLCHCCWSPQSDWSVRCPIIKFCWFLPSFPKSSPNLRSIWFFLVVWNGVLWSDLYNQLLASSVQDGPRGGSFARCNPSCKHHSRVSACFADWFSREKGQFQLISFCSLPSSEGSSSWHRTNKVHGQTCFPLAWNFDTVMATIAVSPWNIMWRVPASSPYP